MGYNHEGQYMLNVPIYINHCVVPWCDSEVVSYDGDVWRKHFCAKHFSTIDSHKVLIFSHSEQIRNGVIDNEDANLFFDTLESIGLSIEFIWSETKTLNTYLVFEGGTLVGISSVKEYRPEYTGQKYHPVVSKGNDYV